MSNNQEREEGKSLLSMELDPENAPGIFTVIAELDPFYPPPPLTDKELHEFVTGLPYPFTHEFKFHLDEGKELADVAYKAQRIRFRADVPRFRIHGWLNREFPRIFGWINQWLPYWPLFRPVEYWMAVDPAVEPQVELAPEDRERIVLFRLRGALEEGEEK